MKPEQSINHETHSFEGLAFGFIGVLCFSLTLPVLSLGVRSLIYEEFRGQVFDLLPPYFLTICMFTSEEGEL